VIAEHMTMTSPRLGDKVLLVDDMVDSGHTLDLVHRTLPQRFPLITACKTAVLWWKACSMCKPDYYVDYLADNPWIRQPFEVYDHLRPDELQARLARS
jgi:hypoxanthine phosphoribosyltransferase